jgi:hypothetical protein
MRGARLRVVAGEDTALAPMFSMSWRNASAAAQAASLGLDLRLEFDPSTFVRGAVTGVLREGVIAAAPPPSTDPVSLHFRRERRPFELR